MDVHFLPPLVPNSTKNTTPLPPIPNNTKNTTPLPPAPDSRNLKKLPEVEISSFAYPRNPTKTQNQRLREMKIDSEINTPRVEDAAKILSTQKMTLPPINPSNTPTHQLDASGRRPSFNPYRGILPPLKLETTTPNASTESSSTNEESEPGYQG